MLSKNLKFLKNGMTLIEVLVAMFILSIALVASLRTATYATSNQLLLKDRTLAEWVGRNRLAERRILGINWHDSGQFEGIVEIGKTKFIWQEKITYIPGSHRAFRLIELTVAKVKTPKALLFRTLDFARRPNN